jgi:hypothetical protein
MLLAGVGAVAWGARLRGGAVAWGTRLRVLSCRLSAWRPFVALGAAGWGFGVDAVWLGWRGVERGWALLRVGVGAGERWCE